MENGYQLISLQEGRVGQLKNPLLPVPYNMSPAAPTIKAMPTPAALAAAPPVDSGRRELVGELGRVTLEELEGSRGGVGAWLEGAIREGVGLGRMLDTWMGVLGRDDSTGVTAARLDETMVADCRVGTLVSRMSEMVREYKIAHSAFWMPSGQQ